MNRRNRWVTPLPGAKLPTESADIIELVSDSDKAGLPLPLPVEMRAGGAPPEIVELYPNTFLPKQPLFDRTAALTELQTAFAQLTDDEIQVARMRIVGAPYADISEELGMSNEDVEKQWKRARRKLGATLFGGGANVTPGTTMPTGPDPDARQETPQETGGTSPV